MSLNYRIILLLLTGALGACEQSNDDLHAFIEETKSKHLGSVKPPPTFQPYKNFIYAASELRDPFEAAFEEDRSDTANAGIRPNANRAKDPLESYPLDTLRMVGILVQNKTTWGLVKDPNNVVHTVRSGEHAGQNDGEIIAITEKQIDIIETIPDGIGGYIEREASLAIGSN
ncbi:MAG TPA: hypothetical protein ENJ08_19045 [Gammaproteobacteria bacterium]|nr:hypothetical protein [Gammaproteobacteria bacterium]